MTAQPAFRRLDSRLCIIGLPAEVETSHDLAAAAAMRGITCDGESRCTPRRACVCSISLPGTPPDLIDSPVQYWLFTGRERDRACLITLLIHLLIPASGLVNA